MTFTRRSALALLCQTVAVGVSLARDEKTEQPRFTCEFRKKEDTFEITGKPGAEVFRIRSVSGIGTATITRRDGMWPETITIRFVRMQYLESFGAMVGKTAISGTHRSASDTIYFDK